MSSKEIEHLYNKYLSNSCTPEEHLELMKLINAGKDDEDIKLLMDKYWNEHSTAHEMAFEKADQIFEHVIAQDKTATIIQPQKRIFSWYRLAAAIAIIALATTLLLFSSHKQRAVIELEAKSAQEHQLIKLPDGSTVVLNKNSFLSYPKSFNKNTREVTLIGEGYFDIVHKDSQPFIVHTGKLVVTVLGTAFNIKAYNQEKNITVTVTRGKVSVSDDQKVLGIITPNQQISFNKETANAVQTIVNATKTIEWQSKDLFLDDMTMQQAALTLSARFNVKITFASDAVKNCRFTGTFLHGEKLEDILQVICAFNNATYKTTPEGHIVISGPGCQ